MIPCHVLVAPLSTLREVVSGTSGVDWVDISCDVLLSEGIECRRGRAGQSETAAAGSLTVKLDNAGGVYTPGRGTELSARLTTLIIEQGVSITSLPADLELRDMPIRVTFWDPILLWTTLWTGVVTRVATSWRGGIRPLVHVTAADAVATLNRVQMLQLPVQMTLAYDPAACYPLDETQPEHAYSAVTAPALRYRTVGSAFAPTQFEWGYASSPGSQPFRPEKGAAGWLSTGAVSGFALDSGNIAGNAGPAMAVPDGPTGGGTGHAMVFPGSSNRTMTAVSWQSPTGGTCELGVDATTTPFVRMPWGTITAADPVTDGQWHHLAVTIDWSLLGVSAALYVDGVSAGTSSTSTTFEHSYGARRVQVGASLAPWVPQCWMGQIANVAHHNEILTSTVIADLAAGRNGWTGETTTDRGLRIARAALRAPTIPTGGSPGMSTMCPSHTSGQTAGQALDDVARTEDSGWWTVPSGVLRVGSRESRWGEPKGPQLPAMSVDAGLEFAADADDRLTEVTATRPNGARVTRRAAPADSGIIYAKTVELLVDSDPQLEAWADWQIAPARSTPTARSETVTADLVVMAYAIDVADLLSTDVDSVIEVIDLPASAPADEMRLLVVGVSDSVNTSGWRRTFNVTPAEQYLAFWELDVSQLDLTTIPAP